jgi:arabinogalactan oligomer/maltooligosaccharide transport system permease protein
MNDFNHLKARGLKKQYFIIKNIFKLLPKTINKKLFNIMRFINNIFINLSDFFRSIRIMLINGDRVTKLSFFIMGAGSFLRKQYFKGISFFIIQIAFVNFLVNFAFRYLVKLDNLGDIAIQEFIDPITQIIFYSVVDNSMIILLYSVLSIFVILAFLVIYFRSIKISYENQIKLSKGVKLKTIKQDIAELLNSKFHITLLTLPSIGIFAFTIVPLIFMILIAFTNFDRFHQPPGNLFTWVGFLNFTQLFTSGSSTAFTFRELLRWTLIWAFLATSLNYILGMLLAIIINKKDIKFKKVWRTIFVLTIAIPQFVSLLLMSRFLHELGVFNVLLQNLGIIDSPIPFLTNGNTARIVVVIVNLWVGIPYSMLITTGILMNIPTDLYESAKIDGAGPIKSFFKITLPYMFFVTGPYIITQFIGNVNNFNVIYLLTGGGPPSLEYFQAGRTDLLVTWLYKLTINEQNFALASTIGIFVFAISAFISLISFNLTASTKNEEDFK